MDFNYESPITKIEQEIASQIVEAEEGKLMYEVKKAVEYDIEKEELIKALQYDRQQYEKGYQDGFNTNKWIPVGVPPKQSGRYLVQTSCNSIYVLRYAKNLYEVDKFDFCDDKGKSGWYDYDSEYGYYKIEDVVAWMPLPSNYQGESE